MSAASRTVCVFCGSRAGSSDAYATSARALGRAIATRGMQLVYGGGNVGLMGLVADAALDAGGTVIGVIPESLVRREVGHRGLHELHVVPNMHVRKRMMAERADAFVALPGGIGTFEELFEVWTWKQLGYHGSALGLLDVGGYYGKLLEFMQPTVAQGFVSAEQMALLDIDTDPDRLIDKLMSSPAGGRLKLDLA